MAVKCLIVTADDFGAAPEVNEAVQAAHRAGILTATSLMVTAPAAADAIARARRMPSLRVGLHLVLVDGRPLLPPSSLPLLVQPNGRFRDDMAAVGTLLLFSRQARRQLTAEITAQFGAFSDSGLTLDHCSAHKHFHLHPLIGGLLASIGPGFGLRAVRLPLEPARWLCKVEPLGLSLSARLTATCALLLRRRLLAAGLAVPDRLAGLRWSGQMTRQRLQRLIRNLPDGVSEIYVHPATGPFAGAADNYRFGEELEALLAPEVIEACRSTGVRLGGFGDFVDRAVAFEPRSSHRRDLPPGALR
jgi:chitin disaccharide deacetylase